MGPVVIFDKSALQGLNMDESVWFEVFFSANIVPLFYVETLADLEKDMPPDRSAESLVGMLAAKTPADAQPSVHHRQLILAELAGYQVPMTGVGVIAEGEARQQPDGKRGLHVGVSAEAEALARWREKNFSELERLGARSWRSELAEHHNSPLVEGLAPMLPDGISNLEQLKAFIDSFCATDDPQAFALALQVLGVPEDQGGGARRRWDAAGRPHLDEFLPYAVHVFKVELLFYLGAGRGFISGERSSNKVDMAYLYYLPFCMVFTSGDRLHQRTAPLFMRPDQSFLGAQELKEAMRELDDHYEQLPDAIKERGAMVFARWPPTDLDNALTRLWDLHMPQDWREHARRAESPLADPIDFEAGRKTVADLEEELASAQPVSEEVAGAVDADPDYVVIKRWVPATKGRWRIVPPEAEATLED
ncbi:MAG: hypothetical protein BroJett024_42980 [Alphaproteobacteria bacterium]|nr:MAG: hypothetical protein BroJett024_42980 [Alphaproteobacteria bacterium]